MAAVFMLLLFANSSEVTNQMLALARPASAYAWRGCGQEGPCAKNQLESVCCFQARARFVASGGSKSMRAQNREPIRSVVTVALMQVLSPEPPYSSCRLSEVIKI